MEWSYLGTSPHEEAFVAHVNAALTPKHRLRLARLIVDDDWPLSRAAEFFNVSWRTAAKWAQRYRDEGPAGMNDRSSARHSQHARTLAPVVRRIVHLRPKQRLGPVPIAAKPGDAGLDGARRAHPVPVEPVDSHRPGHR